jgi:signal transduction histidine kinase
MRARARLRFEILTVCGIVALALWAGIALLLYQAHQQALDGATAAGRNVARSLAEYETSSIRAIDLALQLLRDEWVRDPASFDQAVARQEERLRNENVVQVAVVDREGWTAYSRLPQRERQSFTDRDYFQAQKSRGTDELFVSEPVMGRVTRQWAIQFTRPILDDKRQFAGVMIVAVPPPALEGVFNEIDLGNDGFVTLARADGTILARTGGLAKVTGFNLADSPRLDGTGPVAGEFRGPAKVDGVERLFSYRRLPNYPLTVFVAQGMDVALAAYYKQRNFFVAGGAAATVLLLAVALLLIARGEERARFVEERERLMLELHDGCIQSIYAIGLTLENCRRLVERDPAQAARAIGEAGANLNLVIQELRAFITGEPRAAYTEAEFMAEIERMIPQLGDAGPRFSVDIDRAIIGRLTGQEAEHLLRIAREAVSNIVRHANAKSARLTLTQRADAVCLEVSDDGVGITPQAEARLGLGLHHIQARARKLRGRANVIAAPDRGTRIAVEFSYRGSA